MHVTRLSRTQFLRSSFATGAAMRGDRTRAFSPHSSLLIFVDCWAPSVKEWEQEREARGIRMPPGVCDLERETDGENRGYWPTRDAYLRGRRTAVNVKWRERGCVNGNIWLSFKSIARADLANAVGDLSGQRFQGYSYDPLRNCVDRVWATVTYPRQASPELDSVHLFKFNVGVRQTL
ncbi:hypothetical protein B0H14DRAFT_2641988 [Mycena olivaceomarginata]|nr:hypothetical protein B0H14DRAFT_2641988 [Mycena olivaceomarginata]